MWWLELEDKLGSTYFFCFVFFCFVFFTKKEFNRVLLCHVAVSGE